MVEMATVDLLLLKTAVKVQMFIFLHFNTWSCIIWEKKLLLSATSQTWTTASMV